MHALGAVIGLAGGLLGLSIAFLNTVTAGLSVASGVNDLRYQLLQLALVSLCVLAISGSAVLLWRSRVGAVLLLTGTVGVAVLGSVDIAPYLAPDFRPYFTPWVYPIIAVPLLLAATVLAVLAARRNT